MTPRQPGSAATRWIVHGERLIDGSRKLQLSIASVQLPDGVRFEQYVLRIPRAAMMVVLDGHDRGADDVATPIHQGPGGG